MLQPLLAWLMRFSQTSCLGMAPDTVVNAGHCYNRQRPLCGSRSPKQGPQRLTALGAISVRCIATSSGGKAKTRHSQRTVTSRVEWSKRPFAASGGHQRYKDHLERRPECGNEKDGAHAGGRHEIPYLSTLNAFFIPPWRDHSSHSLSYLYLARYSG